MLESAAGSVAGVVLDSLLTGPVRGARVHLESTSEQVVTDADGRFRFVGLGEGTHRLRVLSPLSDSIGAPPGVMDVEVEAGAITSSRFQAPTLRQAVTGACPDLPEETGVVAGRVLGPLGARAGYTVRAVWQDYGMSPLGRLTVTDAGMELKTADGGRFRVCGVPWEKPVTLTGILPDGRESSLSVSVPPDRPVAFVRIEVKAR